MPRKLDIKTAETQKTDRDEVGAKLSAFTLSKDAPDYEPASTTLTASLDGETVAQAIVTVVWGSLKLEMLHVEPAWRGRGIGREMVRIVEDFARERGCQSVRLMTTSWQGEGFYERAGYTQAAALPSPVTVGGAPQRLLLYVKNLV